MKYFQILFVLTFASAGLGQMSALGLVFDAFANFYFQYFVFSALAVLVFAVNGLWLWFALALVFSAVCAYVVFGGNAYGRRDPVQGERFWKIISFNINYKRREYGQIAEYLERESPDIVFLMEIHREGFERIREMTQFESAEFAGRYQSDFGNAFFSLRVPRDIEMININGSKVPMFRASYDSGNGVFSFYGVHMPIPFGELGILRNRLFGQIAEKIRGDDAASKMIVGDFNTTPYSFHFKKFVSQSGLSDSRAGYGIQNSWPAQLPAFLRIPIDHALISPDIIVKSRKLGQKTKSDHLPLVVEIGFGADNAKRK